MSFVCTKKEPIASQVNSFGLCYQIPLVSKYPNSQEGILVYPSEERTGHSRKDVRCSKSMFALSQDIQCQSQCSSGSTFPRQTSAPESIWNQFSHEDLGQKWGRAPPGQNVFVSKCLRGHKQTEHVFSSCNITVCTGTQLFLHLDDVFLCG